LIPAILFSLLSSSPSAQTPNQDQTPPTAPPPRVQDAVVPPKIVLPITAPSADVPNAPLGSDEAARIALRLQPSLGDAIGALQTARGRTRQIGAGLNPQVYLNGGYNQVTSISGPTTASTEASAGLGPLGPSPVYLYAGGAAIRQLIFDFNQTRNLVRQSKALEGVAAANLTRAQLDLVFAVKSAFYDYTNTRRLVGVNAQNVDNRQRQLDLTSARLSSGLGLPSDVIIAETSKSQGVLALTISRDDEQQARVNLLQLMGVDPATPINVADEPEKPVSAGGPKILVETALRARPEVQSAVQELRASQFGLSAAKALNLPALYAAVSAADAGYNFPLKDNSLSLALGVQFPLYDGGARSGAVQQAKGQIKTAESDLQTAMLSVRSDVIAAYLGLASAEQRVAVVETEVANGQEGVRVAEGRYAAGLGLFQDITTAQGLLLGALTDESAVKSNLDLARTRLRHAIGQSL
jgi:outer membrane protein